MFKYLFNMLSEDFNFVGYLSFFMFLIFIKMLVFEVFSQENDVGSIFCFRLFRGFLCRGFMLCGYFCFILLLVGSDFFGFNVFFMLMYFFFRVSSLVNYFGGVFDSDILKVSYLMVYVSVKIDAVMCSSGIWSFFY